jgi:hypothetical protein
LPVALLSRTVYTEPIQSPTLSTPNASPRVEASTMVPSDDELLATRIYAFKDKCAALASEVALLQGNVSA